MGFSEHRAQLLANLKFLYGSNTEVLTLSHDAGHQAIAMRYDAFSASHTKLLHGNGNSVSTWDAIQCLLQATEVEITKRLSMNGVEVPFSGQGKVEGMMLHRRVADTPAPSSSASSEQFIATPQSSVSGRDIPHPCECYEVTIVGQSQNEAPPMTEDAGDIWAAPTSSKKKKKGKKVPSDFDWSPVEPVAKEAIPQDSLPVLEHISPQVTQPVDEWDSFWGVKKSKKGKSSLAYASECSVVIEQTPTSQTDAIVETAVSDPVADFDWGFSSTSKKDKKKGKKATSCFLEDVVDPLPAAEQQDQPPPSEQLPTEEPPKVEEAPPPATKDDPWAMWAASSSKKSKKDKKKKVRIETPPPESEVAVEEPPTSEFSVPAPLDPELERAPSPPPALEPEPVPEEDDWGSFGIKSKKDKKKKKSFGFEVEAQVPESMTPEPVPEESQWDFSSTKTNMSDGSIIVEEIVAPDPEPEPVIEDDGWGSFGVSKKDKKKKKKSESVFDERMDPPPADIEPAATESEPVIEDDGWGSFGVSKKDKKRKKSVDVFEFAVEEDVPKAEVPEPSIPEPEAAADDFGWGSFTTSKKDKKKKKAGFVFEEEVIPAAEPEPEPAVAVDEDLGWGSFGGKKDKKKKKAGFVFEEEVPPPPAEEVVEYAKDDVPPSVVVEVVEEPKDEMVPLPTISEEVVPTESVSWMDNWRLRKAEESPRIDEPISEPAAPEDDGWGSFSTKKKGGKKGKKGKSSRTEEPVVECPIQNCPCDAIHTAIIDPPSPPTITPPASPPLENTVNTQVEIINNPPPSPLLGKTIVLKIIHIRQNDSKYTCIGKMVTLQENTLYGIFLAVNTYLDSKTEPKERKMEIKEAVGRGGGTFDVSELEEGKWGEYLEYFEGFTRFPELVVEVVDL